MECFEVKEVPFHPWTLPNGWQLQGCKAFSPVGYWVVGSLLTGDGYGKTAPFFWLEGMAVLRNVGENVL